jgi:hypothetical protein
MRTTRRRPSRLTFVIGPAIVGFALLAAAGLIYRNQVATDNGFADHGITTTAVISSVFHGPLSLDPVSGAQSSYTLYGVVAFTAVSGPAQAQVPLEDCSGVCQDFRDGQRLMITYDSRNPANVEVGRPANPYLHLTFATVFVALLGLLLLFAAVFNLVAGV